MEKDTVRIIPVKVKQGNINAADRIDHPIRRALNVHFGFKPDFQLVFCLKQDTMIKSEHNRFNMMIMDYDGYLIMPEFDEEAHYKMERFLKGQMIRPFTFMFSVTEKGIDAIKVWRHKYRLDKHKPMNI